MQTKPPDNLDKSPFAGLFKKHPWLIPVLAMINRQLGVYKEFYEINVKPFTRK